MNVLSINSVDQQTQNKTVFKARVPKKVMKELAKESINWDTLKGLAAIGAAAVAAKNIADKKVDSKKGYEFDMYSDIEDLDNVRYFNKLSNEEFYKVFTTPDETGKALVHRVLSKDMENEGEVLYRFVNLIKDREDNRGFDKTADILCCKDRNNRPAFMLCWDFLFDKFKKNEELMSKMVNTTGVYGDTMIHSMSVEEIEYLADTLKRNPDCMADLLISKNSFGESVYKTPGRKREPIKEIIINFVTNSDLSTEKSIAVLEANELEPELVKYLKLQLDAENK